MRGVLVACVVSLAGCGGGGAAAHKRLLGDPEACSYKEIPSSSPA